MSLYEFHYTTFKKIVEEGVHFFGSAFQSKNDQRMTNVDRKKCRVHGQKSTFQSVHGPRPHFIDTQYFLLAKFTNRQYNDLYPFLFSPSSCTRTGKTAIYSLAVLNSQGNENIVQLSCVFECLNNGTCLLIGKLFSLILS